MKCKGKHKGPKACGDLFKQGYWVDMIAHKFKITMAEVESKLMERIRKLEKQVKIMGGKP